MRPQLQCIRDHFKLRREAVATLAKANAALDKHEREKSALVAKGGRAERVERLDTQIQEVRLPTASGEEDRGAGPGHAARSQQPLMPPHWTHRRPQDKNAVRRCQYRASFMTKGLVHCEIDRLWCAARIDAAQRLSSYAPAFG